MLPKSGPTERPVRVIRLLLRRLRSVPPFNWLLTSLVRALSFGRAPSWAVEHLPRLGEVTVRLPGNASVRFYSAGDDWITSRLWWLGLRGFEPETLLPFLRLAADAECILDIGSYTGVYALAAAAVNPRARVFAFEPHPAILARLGHNLSLNPALAVTCLPYAVGPRTGPATLHVGGPGLPSSSSVSDAWKGIHASLATAMIDVDAFVAQWGLDRVDLIKMDVETAEPGVIDGMAHTLRRDRPVIITEVLPGADEAYGRMAATLRAIDYRFYHLRHDGPVGEQDLRGSDNYIDHLTTPVNHLLCPAERIPPWLAATTVRR